MTLEEISNTLPHGFHDATLDELHISYAARTITMRLTLWIGSKIVDGEEHDRLALVTVKLDDFQYYIIEPPVGAKLLDEHDHSTIDDRQWHEDNPSLPKLGDGMFPFSFWVFNWMASIHLAAKSATMTYDDPQNEQYVQRVMAERV
jgi:hypothetical protein